MTDAHASDPVDPDPEATIAALLRKRRRRRRDPSPPPLTRKERLLAHVSKKVSATRFAFASLVAGVLWTAALPSVSVVTGELKPRGTRAARAGKRAAATPRIVAAATNGPLLRRGSSPWPRIVRCSAAAANRPDRRRDHESSTAPPRPRIDRSDAAPASRPR